MSQRPGTQNAIGSQRLLSARHGTHRPCCCLASISIELVYNQHLLGLWMLVLLIRQTETIRLQKFRSLILKTRRRLEHPVRFTALKLPDSLTHLHKIQKGLGSTPLSSPSSLMRDTSRFTS